MRYLLALLFYFSGVAQASSALIYINEYRGYTRFIYDLPKQTLNNVENKGKLIKITIKKGYDYKVPTSFRKNSYVKSIRIIQQKDKLITNITVSQSVKLRRLRYGESLIFDIVEPKSKPIPSPKPESKKPDKPKVKAKDKSIEKASKSKKKNDKMVLPKDLGQLPDQQKALTQQKNIVIDFNFIKKTKICVFNIGAFVYVVATTKKIKNKLPSHITLSHPNVGIWRFKTFLNPIITTTPANSKFRKWRVNIVKSQQKPAESVNTLEYIVDKTKGKYFVIRDIIDPVILKIFDKDLSTYFNVVLLQDLYRRSVNAQRFNNFTLLPTAIGYAFASNNHNFNITYGEEAIMIKPGANTYMSPPDDRNSNRVSKIEYEPFLSFYNPKPYSRLFAHVKELSKKLLKTKYKRNIYHKIGDLYANAGIYDRSIVFYKNALMGSVRKNNRLILSAKLGVFSLLAGDMPMAYTYLFLPDLLVEQALDPWRGLYMIEKNNSQKAMEYFKKLPGILPLINKKFINTLLLHAMDLYLSNGKDITPLTKLFDEHRSDWIEFDHFQYNQGQNYLNLGMVEHGVRKFDSIINRGGRESLYNLSALVHKILTSYDYGKLHTNDAIKALEDLRYNSKQRHLRFLVLDKLRQLYYQKHQYRQAIEVSNQIARRFPEKYKQGNILQFAKDAFFSAFVNSNKTFGSPHNTIVFFHHYQKLLPTDKDKLFQVYMKIIEAYFRLDLLDETEDLIVYLNNKLGMNTPETITHLSQIYLADERPQTAVRFLSKLKQLTGMQKYFMAQALITSKQWFRAKQFLKKAPFEDKFNALRLELAWSNNDFYYAETVLEIIIKKQQLKGKADPLHIINLASAVRRQNNFTKLHKISKTYEKQVKGTKYHKLFNYITKVNSFLILVQWMLRLP